MPRRQVFFYLACSFFVVAALLAVEAMTKGEGFKLAAAAAFSLGALFSMATWAAGLPKREQASTLHD